ncbi:MAG: nitrate reductase molybdenum cofactor assembly chaperone [Steroidobacteraceae bacterium]|nr:nitrate reductase molybdenum cofactor assembly chaperone [Steroidobacteraceae bacterium]MCW5572610.1 nitrate reductase molybdenum cofactor assembly chaperone [Steroidobacteraceae bacterium]
MNPLKLVSVLLDYPQDEMWQHRGELLAAVDDCGLAPRQRAALAGFVGELLDSDPLAAQDNWLGLFDRGRSMSLLLFEHIHGESRDRGQAMVDLLEAYRRNGFELAAKELPDYLPLLLEYLSHRPQHESVDWLQHIGHIVALLAARAAERQSRYAVLFDILVDIGAGRLDVRALRERASTEPRDDTPEAMDRLWEEEAVRFGVEAPDRDCAPTSRQVPR